MADAPFVFTQQDFDTYDGSVVGNVDGTTFTARGYNNYGQYLRKTQFIPQCFKHKVKFKWDQTGSNASSGAGGLVWAVTTTSDLSLYSWVGQHGGNKYHSDIGRMYLYVGPTAGYNCRVIFASPYGSLFWTSGDDLDDDAIVTATITKFWDRMQLEIHCDEFHEYYKTNWYQAPNITYNYLWGWSPTTHYWTYSGDDGWQYIAGDYEGQFLRTYVTVDSLQISDTDSSMEDIFSGAMLGGEAEVMSVAGITHIVELTGDYPGLYEWRQGAARKLNRMHKIKYTNKSGTVDNGYFISINDKEGHVGTADIIEYNIPDQTIRFEYNYLNRPIKGGPYHEGGMHCYVSAFPGTSQTGSFDIEGVAHTKEREICEVRDGRFHNNATVLSGATWGVDEHSTMYVHTPPEYRQGFKLSAMHSSYAREVLVLYAISHIHIDGLAFNMIGNYNENAIKVTCQYEQDIKISNCTVYSYIRNGVYALQAIHVDAGLGGNIGEMQLWNNQVKMLDNPMGCACYVFIGQINARISNCTAIGGRTGFSDGSSTGKFLKFINCLSAERTSHTTDFYFPYSEHIVEVSYCAANNSIPHGTTGNRENQTFDFVNHDEHPANYLYWDYHLSTDDTGAYGHGTDLSDDTNHAFDTDLIGDSRPGWGNWTIGAFAGLPFEVSGGAEMGGSAVMEYKAAIFEMQGGVEIADGWPEQADVTQYGIHISTVGPGKDYESLNDWQYGERRNLTTSFSLFISNISGTFTDGEQITCSPFGAIGNYIENDSTSMRAVFLTGNSPVVGDTITGSSSGATATVDLIHYKGEIEIAECYPFEDTTPVLFSGWITSGYNFIYVKAVDTHRHSGVWTTNAYRLVTSSNSIYTQSYDMILDGLQIHGTQGHRTIHASNPKDLKIRNCILENLYAAGETVYADLNTYGYSIELQNNIIIGGYYGIVADVTGDAKARIHNNTIVYSYYGIHAYIQDSSAHWIYNNITAYCVNHGFRKTGSGIFVMETQKNLTTDTTQGDYPYIFEYTNSWPTFLNPGWIDLYASKIYGDFRLSPYDTVAKDMGADLSADGTNTVYNFPSEGYNYGYQYTPFSDDIDDNTRPEYASWDIGASEAHPDYISLNIDGTGGCSMGGEASLVGVNISQIGPGKQYANMGEWVEGEHRDLTQTWKVKVSSSNLDNTSNTLTFSPSGAAARFINQSTGWVRFEVTSGTPATGDTITSDVSGTATISSIMHTREIEMAEFYNFVDSTHNYYEIHNIEDNPSTGWQTSKECYIKMYTPMSERHNGTPHTGYRWEDDFGLRILVPFVWVDGLVVDSKYHCYLSYYDLAEHFDDPESWIKISNCVFYQNDPTPNFSTNGIVIYSNKGNVYAWNNTIYISNTLFGLGVTTVIYRGGGSEIKEPKKWRFYNHTVVGGYYGYAIHNFENESVQFWNCIGTNATSKDFYLSYDGDLSGNELYCNFCACEDHSLSLYAPGSNNYQTICNFTFADEGDLNFLLSLEDEFAVGEGSDLILANNNPAFDLVLQEFDNIDVDIIGSARPGWTGLWSIGSSEPVAVSSGGAIVGERLNGGVRLGGQYESGGEIHNITAEGGVEAGGDSIDGSGAPADGGATISGEAWVSPLFGWRTVYETPNHYAESMARTSDGAIYVCNGSTSKITIYKSIDDGLTWTSEDIGTEEAYSYVDMIADENNHLYLTYRGTDTTCYFATNRDGTWDIEGKGTSPSVSYLNLDSSNNIYLTIGKNNLSVICYKYTDGTWDTGTSIIGSDHNYLEATTIDTNDVMHFVYASDHDPDDYMKIKHNTLTDGTVGTEKNVFNSGVYQNPDYVTPTAKMTADSNDNLHLCFFFWPISLVWYSRYNGSSWSTVQISPVGESMSGGIPYVNRDLNDNIDIMFADNVSTGRYVYASYHMRVDTNGKREMIGLLNTRPISNEYQQCGQHLNPRGVNQPKEGFEFVGSDTTIDDITRLFSTDFIRFQTQGWTGQGGAEISGESDVFREPMDETAQGGATVSGDSEDSITVIVEGGVLAGGAATEYSFREETSDGGVVHGGSALAPHIHNVDIEGGGVTIAGEAEELWYIPIGGGVLVNGTAVETHQISKYLDVPHEAADRLGNSTFVFWLKTASNDEQAIFSGANENKDNELLIRLKSGTVLSFSNHTNGD